MRFIVNGIVSLVALILYVLVCAWISLFLIGVLSAYITTGALPPVLPKTLIECAMLALRHNTVCAMAFVCLHLLGGRSDLSGVQRTIRIVTAILLAFGSAVLIIHTVGPKYVAISCGIYILLGLAFLHDDPDGSADRTKDVLAGPTGRTLSAMRRLNKIGRSK